MKLIKPLLIALSTYTALPLPKVDFVEEDMKFSMCFLPLVGLLVGAGFCLWAWLARLLQFGNLLRAVGLVLAPLLLTGGIHMDGFLDTSDALSSWQPLEKKLEILKDVHVGAFSVIRAGMYLLAMLGIYSEAEKGQILVLAFGFVLSRCLCVLMFNLLPNARGAGMLSSFQENQGKRAVLVSAALFAVAAIVVGLGISWKGMLTGVAAASLGGLWFSKMAMRKFGGMTGDLAGYLIQIAELSFAGGAVLIGRLL